VCIKETLLSQWFYAKGQRRYGPFRSEEIENSIKSGKVTPDDLLWTEGMSEWVRLRSLSNGFGECLPSVGNSDAGRQPQGHAALSSVQRKGEAVKSAVCEGSEEGAPCIPPPLPVEGDLIDRPEGLPRARRVADARRNAITIVAVVIVLCGGWWFLRRDAARVRVSGLVSYRGKPVTRGRVVLCEKSCDKSYIATVSASGRYEFHASRKAGVRAGIYRISILPPPPLVVMDQDKGTMVVQPVQCDEIPEQYRDRATSGWTVHVPSRGGVIMNLDM
jgi:hypothetical protein